MRSSQRRLAPAALLTLALLGVPLVGTASAAHVSCGQRITQNTVLDANVGPCPGDGIIIGADNIVLDLNGFTVSGTDAGGEGAGILLEGRTGVTVRNGTVTRFDAGVVILVGSGNTVTRVLAHDNIGNLSSDFGDGILVFASSGNRIQQNVVRHNGPYSGISLFGDADNNLVDSNVAQDNNVDFAPTFNQDQGIRVEGRGADNNTVSNNSVTGSGLDGIIVFGYPSGTQNVGNVLRRNVTRNNGFHDKGHRRGNGIVTGGPQTLVENNVSQSNAASGIRVNSTNNTIRFNTATNNALSVNANTGPAFDLQDTQPNCDNNLWQSNTYVTRSQPCIS
ncbi:MAG TPA: right-handed parallel beta-helix repeat-containing protein [Acidimicrobiales bacterium]|nr:right-handed parallel beta-helix repeat-containing protein [Acidimicrobiales bacterium]